MVAEEKINRKDAYLSSSLFFYTILVLLLHGNMQKTEINQKTNISANIKIGLIISWVTLICSVLLTIFYTPFLLKKVGDVEYGLKSYVDSLVSWLNLLTFGVTSAFIRFSTLALKKANPNEETSRVNGVFIVLLSASMFFSLLLGFGLLLLFETGAIPLTIYSADEQNTIFLLLIVSTIQISLSFPLTIFSLEISFNNRFYLAQIHRFAFDYRDSGYLFASLAEWLSHRYHGSCCLVCITFFRAS
jgi:hypothetical protein